MAQDAHTVRDHRDHA